LCKAQRAILGRSELEENFLNTLRESHWRPLHALQGLLGAGFFKQILHRANQVKYRDILQADKAAGELLVVS